MPKLTASFAYILERHCEGDLKINLQLESILPQLTYRPVSEKMNIFSAFEILELLVMQH